VATIPFILNAIAASGIGPESGAKAYTYVKDTSTPLAVYTDTGLSIAAANPVVANSLGYMVFYFSSTLNYTIVIKTANDATTLLTVTYTASGSVIAVTQGTVPNYNALTTSIFALESVYQGLDVDLTAYAGLTGTGFVKRTGSGTASTVGETGTGSVVLATGPTLSAPVVSSTDPRLDLYITGAPTNEKRWSIIADGGASGSLNLLQTRTDADGFGENVIRATRSGTDATEIIVAAPISIQPDANSFERGFSITQTSPTDATLYVGPKYFNQIDVVVRSNIGETGIPGNVGSATYAGLQCSVNAGGTNFYAISVMGGSYGVVQTLDDNSIGDKNGLSSGVYIDAVTPGRGYGGSSGATITENGEAAALVGYETDVVLEGAADNVVGFNSWQGGAEQGTNVHAAYAIASSGGTGPYGNGVAGWKQGIVLFTESGGTNDPMDPTGSLLTSDHNADIANIFDYWPAGTGQVTVTGKILGFQYCTLWGNEGLLELKGTSSTPGRVRLYEDTDNGTNYVDVTTAANLPGNQTVTLDENEWATFTPTLTPQSGSITTSSASGRYRRLFGRTVVVNMRATLTTVGTASGSLSFSLPVNASTTIPIGILNGKEVGTTGKGVAGVVTSATTANCFFVDSDSVFTGGNGTIVDVTMTYEAAA
jgi:hypothetical protein